MPLNLIRHYVELQERLLAAFVEAGCVEWRWGDPWFKIRKGTLVANGETWSFQVHGSGVRFTHRQSREVVDPGAWIDHPRIFDWWIICQYAVSLGLRELEFEGTSYPLVDEEGDPNPHVGTRRLFDVLLERNLIKKVPVDERHFAYALAEDAEPHAPVGAPEEGKEN